MTVEETDVGVGVVGGTLGATLSVIMVGGALSSVSVASRTSWELYSSRTSVVAIA